ncbi:catabolite control protein A [Clostridium butyricum]|uniref:Catabolite control protein A n=1 Tax=Clostridium butyricum TaxID=1492 RepID=A0A512TSK5_CLOBU|nr:LacI family DNA-binding transcriptional regulator [Clostridium butyricum]NOW25224.1 LacI family transcriptional regulator [Clostridium butyricum]GEQ23264.1 catabolite control protein A [Clostridium butyricum]
MAKTIGDIAKEAGVSISTVSRVINNTKPVNPELRERVYEVIKKNNFKPNVLARGLITKKTNTIGVIIPDISNAVFGALTKGINSVSSKKGYTLMVCESGGEQETELKLLDVLEDKRIDGILFAGVNVSQTLVNTMKQKDYPVVLVTQEASVGSNVMNTVIHDNVQAAYDAVNFLIDNGHKKIAYLGGPKYDFSNGEKRLRGYKKALETAGIEPLDSYIIQGDFSFQFGYDGMKKLYEENRILPTAVVAGSDLIAVGAIQFMYTVGLKVPDEMSIIGFDDLEFTTYFKPELSTIRIPYFEEGEIATKELLKLMEGKKVDPVTHYVSHKIIRRSTIKSCK